MDVPFFLHHSMCAPPKVLYHYQRKWPSLKDKDQFSVTSTWTVSCASLLEPSNEFSRDRNVLLTNLCKLLPSLQPWSLITWDIRHSECRMRKPRWILLKYIPKCPAWPWRIILGKMRTVFNVRPCLWLQLHLHAISHVTCAKPLPAFF